jgi:two-component system, chemotaxis family, protein-glutamate methylesterase/glutaminase
MDAALEASPGPVSSDTPIKVMIVDDSAVVRGLVARWIEEEEAGLEVVARHANGRLAVDDIVRSAPDIVLLDIEMPVMDGLEALPLLLEARSETRVLIISTLTRRNAEISLKALSLGALDYVPKPDSNREVTTSLDFRGEVIRKIKLLGRARTHRPGKGDPARSEADVRPLTFRQRSFGAAANRGDRLFDGRSRGPDNSARGGGVLVGPGPDRRRPASRRFCPRSESPRPGENSSRVSGHDGA